MLQVINAAPSEKKYQDDIDTKKRCLSCQASQIVSSQQKPLSLSTQPAAGNPYLLPTPPPYAKRSTSDPDLYSLENQKLLGSNEASPLRLPSRSAPATTVTAPPCTAATSPTSQKSMDIKLAYVDNLVDTTAKVIEAIWPVVTKPKSNVVPLRTFIQEVLKRSRTTYSTLQTALFYLFRVKNTILNRLQGHSSIATTIQREQDYISCGRRMFLASVILASKFLQDRNYRNSAWAKISGLPVREINAAEMVFMKLIDCNLYISKATFDQWYNLLNSHINGKARRQPILPTPHVNTDVERLSIQHSYQIQKVPQSLQPLSPPLSQSGSPNCACNTPAHPDSAVSLTQDNFSPPLSGKLSGKRTYAEDSSDDTSAFKRVKREKDEFSLVMGW